MKHLIYQYDSAYDVGENRHALDVMKELGVKYQLAVPQTLGSCWQFFNCTEIPEKLPVFITELNVPLASMIGYGLSKEDVKDLTITLPPSLN